MKQYENVSVSAGRDYRHSSGFEYVVMAEVGDDDWIVLAREGSFKSNGAAKRAGLKAAEPFVAPALI